jgi:CheY-like chemotaxis protein
MTDAAPLVVRRDGLVVRALCDGEAALAAAERTPSVAVLDVSMPPMDGLDTARRLRERAATSAVPIMLLTPASPSPTASAAARPALTPSSTSPSHPPSSPSASARCSPSGRPEDPPHEHH